MKQKKQRKVPKVQIEGEVYKLRFKCPQLQSILRFKKVHLRRRQCGSMKLRTLDKKIYMSCNCQFCRASKSYVYHRILELYRQFGLDLKNGDKITLETFYNCLKIRQKFQNTNHQPIPLRDLAMQNLKCEDVEKFPSTSRAETFIQKHADNEIKWQLFVSEHVIVTSTSVPQIVLQSLPGVLWSHLGEYLETDHDWYCYGFNGCPGWIRAKSTIPKNHE